MSFKEFLYFLENANTRSVDPSGGGGLNPMQAPSPQTKSPRLGGSFGGGVQIKVDMKPSPFSIGCKDSPSDLKKFNGRPPSPFASVDIHVKPFKPGTSPFSSDPLSGPVGKKESTKKIQPTKKSELRI